MITNESGTKVTSWVIWLRIAGMLWVILPQLPVRGATSQERYYAYDKVEDQYGVIAPWYKGQNGQFDFRIRVAAETLKRYPWVDTSKAITAAPEYMFRGFWKIDPNGTITIPPLGSWQWENGDMGHRAAFVLNGLINYYRYSGDPAAIAHITLLADILLNNCQTNSDHPWPTFIISVPNKGKSYGRCDPNGFIQLDHATEIGIELLRAYKLTGNTRWSNAVRHWADVLAEKCDMQAAGNCPWRRYANPDAVAWDDRMTGSVACLLTFLDDVIETGYTGKNNSIVKARDAGRAYFRDVLLPQWTANEAWGRSYWDGVSSHQSITTTEWAVRYLLENPRYFPNWNNDARNIMSLLFNHSTVSPESNGDVYSGAWQIPESPTCCGRSIGHCGVMFAGMMANYAELSGSEWAREIARRQTVMGTYDFRESGFVEDNIDGGVIVAGNWFNVAHPLSLKYVLDIMGWLPDVLGANRENHIMRTSSVVNSVVYGKGRIVYSTFDAPENTVDVLRLAFRPVRVTANGKLLQLRSDLTRNGYQLRELSTGDCIISIRHDGRTNIMIKGDDSQKVVDDDGLTYKGDWSTSTHKNDLGGDVHISSSPGAAMTYSFVGNQVRLIGRVGPAGGLADVYVDDVKQLVGIDYWNPETIHQQVLYYKNGLSNDRHEIKVVARGAGNLVSMGANIYIDGIQWSAATGDSGFGEGGGPTDTQRMIFGYTGRKDYVDSAGNRWRPGTEFVIRTGNNTDSVAQSWWTRRRGFLITGTPDPELYGYGVHGREFWVNVTVGPGVYYVRLKFAETRGANASGYTRKIEPNLCAVTVYINGREVVTDLDIVATANRLGKAGGGFGEAVDLVFNNIYPRNGIIEIRFSNNYGGEAIVQAIEIGLGSGGKGDRPVSLAGNRQGTGNKTNAWHENR